GATPPAPHRRPRSASRASDRSPPRGACGAPRIVPPATLARPSVTFLRRVGSYRIDPRTHADVTKGEHNESLRGRSERRDRHTTRSTVARPGHARARGACAGWAPTPPQARGAPTPGWA